MNRLSRDAEMPKPQGPFSDTEAFALLLSYERDPSNLHCPRCGPDCVEVLAFIEPAIGAEGFAVVREPEGTYAAAVYCHTCQRAIGILASTLAFNH